MIKALVAISFVVAVYVMNFSPYFSPVPAQDGAPVSQVRFAAGGAKFMLSEKPPAPPPAPKNPMVIDLMQKQAHPATNRLSLGNLKKRQAAQRSGHVTQRFGSASLPKHNDVRRMDGMISE